MGGMDQEKQRRGQLHELLAVDRDLEQRDQATRKEGIHMLSQPDTFRGFTKTLTMRDQNDQHEEDANKETRVLSWTVGAVLDRMFAASVQYVDALGQKERTNQDALANVVIDGEVILKAVPVTALLALEKQVVEWHKVIQAVPVLSAGVEWEIDTTLGDDIFKAAEPIKRLRTKNYKKPLELSPATERHPAQVQLIDDTKVTGEYTETHWSGMMKPKRKIELLDRINKLGDAVKKARMRANKTEIVHVELGEPIFKWLMAE